MNEINYVTQEAMDSMREELDYLKTVKRREIMDDLLEARKHGDFTDNPDYVGVKQKQAYFENLISDLQNKIANSKVKGTDSQEE